MIDIRHTPVIRLDPLAQYRSVVRQIIRPSDNPYHDHISCLEARASTGALTHLGDGCYQVRKG